MKPSRRAFLRQMFIEPVASDAGAKTLVCIFLRGGADTLNMVAPYGDDDYYRLRPTLSIAPPSKGGADASIRLDDFYALHPRMQPLHSIFLEGRLGIVHATGSDNITGSHFEAQDQMEHGEAFGKTIGGGWIGRHLRSRAGREATPLSAIAIGPVIPESLRGAQQSTAINSLDEIQIRIPSGDPQSALLALSAMYAADAGVLNQPGRATLDLLRRVENLRGRDYKTESGVEYPGDEFSAGLREIARLIKAEVGLEAACIDLGGWDTHFFQGTTDGLQAQNIAQLSRGLAAFDADLKSHSNRVITLVMTEFGRRVYENGSLGTDHGRGFALLALGDGINGGRVLGRWPGLEEDEKEILGPGGLKITTDYRSALAEVITFGLGNPNLEKIFPDFHPEPVELVRRAPEL
jgi:uncharacterized protein (DUF1501 family)